MHVLVPGALHSYTNCPRVQAEGRTVGEVIDDLERQFPGIRFRMIDEQGRIRQHIRLFHQRDMVFDLATPLPADSELVIVQALSGG